MSSQALSVMPLVHVAQALLRSGCSVLQPRARFHFMQFARKKCMLQSHFSWLFHQQIGCQSRLSLTMRIRKEVHTNLVHEISDQQNLWAAGQHATRSTLAISAKSQDGCATCNATCNGCSCIT